MRDPPADGGLANKVVRRTGMVHHAAAAIPRWSLDLANHPSSYAGITRDGLVLALLDRLVEADGRKPESNNPPDRAYLLNRLQEIMHILNHPSTPRPDLP
jgi:hypothetical protein